MQDGSTKQLVTERIKNATNILVTVSSNPNVDALSSALALTMMLNKLDKHGTAVFSGEVPAAINFLEPAKTFESTVDSLRDFIIALDKEKADRLRYKVEDDVVRIFITPYRTTITQNDLDFSQGDFNVELIVALGVEKREDLDKAIIAHGRILHDATVVTINAGTGASDLGEVDWQDPNASSLSEMLVSMSESLGNGLLDQQIANALLTGIVSATERFSNVKTTPKVMTMAAQLMAAGANQQLIATRLEEAHDIPSQTQSDTGSKALKDGEASQKVEKISKKVKKPRDGEMVVEHEAAKSAAIAATAAAVSAEEAVSATAKDEPQAEYTLQSGPVDAEQQLEQDLSQSAPSISRASAATNIIDELAAENDKIQNETGSAPSWKGRNIEPPTMGGTLNATTEEAHDESMKEEESNRNHRLLSHDAPQSPPPVFNGSDVTDEQEPTVPSIADAPTFSDLPAPAVTPTEPPITPLTPQDDGVDEQPIAQDSNNSDDEQVSGEQDQPATLDSMPMPSFEPTPSAFEQPVGSAKSEPTLAELEAQAHAHANESQSLQDDVKSDVDQARDAVSSAFDATPFNPANNPATNMGTTPLPEINHVPEAPSPATPPPSFSMPPMPDMSTLPPLPPQEPAAPDFSTLPQESPLDQYTDPNSKNPDDTQVPPSNDPGQFKIPGQ